MTTATLATLENTMTRIAGHQVEITIRGEREFTFSFEAIDVAAGKRIAAFIKSGGAKKTEIATDEELDMTFIYADA